MNTVKAPPRWRRPWRLARYWLLRLRHNLPQKLLALLAATVCWYFATEDRRATIQQRYDVALTARDNTRSGEKRAVSGLSPSTVQVTLSGTRQRLAGVNAGDIEAFVDVTDLPEGTFTRTIRVDGPDNTRSVKVAPATAQGQIDAQKTRTQPVLVSTLALSGAPSSGPSSPRYLAAPAQVSVSGPSRLVGSVVRVVTAPLSLGQGEAREARLLALDGQGQVVDVTLRPASVMVSRTDTGTLPIHTLPVRLSSAPSNFKVTAQITPPSVRVLGPVGSAPGGVLAQVPYHLGRYTVQPDLTLPPGVYSLDKVTVHLSVEAR